MVGTMAKIDDSVKKKVPELRFKGFTDEWEERKLSTESTITAGGDIDKSKLKEVGEYPILANALTNDGIVGYYDSSYRVEAPAVTVTGRGDVGHAKARKVNFTPVVRLLSVKSKHDVDFLENAINNHKVLVESTGVPQLTAPQLGNYKIFFPTGEEQEKIGSFFKQLDDTIALHQYKLDLLKEQKKGYLQKMFPKNGAKVPELRFAGFADDWEERKLGEVIDIENGYAFKSEYFSDEEKRHIVLTPGSVKIGGGFQKDKGRYYDVSGVFPEKFIFKPGNIFITMTDLTPTAQSLGYPAIVPRDDNVYLHNQRLGKIINTTTNPEFLYTLLTTDTYHKEIVSSASGTTVKHSSVSKILDFKSAIPNIDEQKLIGSFFKELDNTIALHQRKLDLLKEQKKGFLQKMFV
ncbi:restriction endonuclease subunit S [Lactococcus lactis]|uniref:restriction endonuclease subunit S n=1 Tax=Lactococcus lactis TaxID=1358 RepID=UPI00128F5EB2